MPPTSLLAVLLNFHLPDHGGAGTSQNYIPELYRGRGNRISFSMRILILTFIVQLIFIASHKVKYIL